MNMPIKILSAQQIRLVDAATIRNEPVSSLDLMERAAQNCLEAFLPYLYLGQPIHVFCGSGNNGGDGFVIARLLKIMEFDVFTWFVTFSEPTPECAANKARATGVVELVTAADFPDLTAGLTVIDALLGTGTSRAPEGVLKALIEHINASSAQVLSVDIPSGLPADFIPEWETAIAAGFTATFHQPKLTFFLKETAVFAGNWRCIDIGLDQKALDQQNTRYFQLDDAFVTSLVIPRQRFSHKGTYGHGLLIAGSKGKMGAAVLSSKAALRSGIGLLSAHIPAIGLNVLQTAVPEAMCFPDPNEERVSRLFADWEAYSAVGIGPGLGTHDDSLHVLSDVIAHHSTVVIDADALNVLAAHPQLLENLPEHTVLTPHPKEFERLAGNSVSTGDRLDRLVHFAQAYRCTVILKDAISAVATKDGKVYFNTTGNPGMATGGSGDVLTGIVLGLLAQGYSPEHAAMIAVYFHGKAGDAVAAERGQAALIAGDLVESLRIRGRSSR